MPLIPRLTRELVDRLPERVDERGPIRVVDPDPEFYDRTSQQIIDNLHAPNELWIFAIGSLIWNPRCEISERRPALVRGWQRSFCLGPDQRFRGNPSAPGMMLSMDQGGECWGVAMRMQPDDLQNALVTLLKLEPPSPPVWVQAETETGTVPAIAFTMDHDFPLYQPEPPLHELADILASAVGHIGSMADYLLNTITELENAGVHDLHLWTLQDMVAERLERLG